MPDEIDNTPPPAAADEGFKEKGLAAGLEDFLAQGDDYVPPSNEPDIKPDEKPAPVSLTPKEKKPAEASEEDESGDEEEEFPEIGATEKKEAPKPDEEDDEAFEAELAEETKGMEPKAGEKWKAIKAELRAAKQEAAALKENKAASPEVEAELATLREEVKQVEVLRQRNEELLKVRDEVSVRHSDEYISKITAPIQEMDSIVAQMAESSGVDPKLLGAIITESDVVKQDKMIEDIELKLGRRGAGRLERLADDFKQIRATEADMLANASKTIASSHSQREAQESERKVSMANEFKTFTGSSFKAHGSKIPGFTDSSGNLTDLAKAVEAKTASLDPSTLSPADLGYMAFAANSLPEIRKAFVALQKENAILKGGKKPAPIGDGKIPKADSRDEGPDRMGLAEHMANADLTWNGAQ